MTDISEHVLRRVKETREKKHKNLDLSGIILADTDEDPSDNLKKGEEKWKLAVGCFLRPCFL
jgi:hypothetical protein